MGLTAGLLACVLLAAAEDKAKTAKPDDPLEGTWAVVSAVMDGKELEEFKKDKVLYTFKGGKARRRAEGARTTTYTLDPAHEPAAIDLVPDAGPAKGQTFKGIYAVQGGELRFCVALAPGGERPREFASKEGARLMLSKLKRE